MKTCCKIQSSLDDGFSKINNSQHDVPTPLTLHQVAWNRTTTNLPSFLPSFITFANSSRDTTPLTFAGRTASLLRLVRCATMSLILLWKSRSTSISATSSSLKDMLVELLPDCDVDDRRIGRIVDDGGGGEWEWDDGTTYAVVATAMPMVMICAMFFMAK